MKAETLHKENEILKSRIAELETEREGLESNNQDLSSKVSQLSTLTAQLKEQVNLLQLLHFGTKSEKMTSEDKKTASLSSTGNPSDASLIFILQFAEAIASTVHGCVPLFAVFAIKSVQSEPPFVEYSILTLPTVPVVDQVIL